MTLKFLLNVKECTKIYGEKVSSRNDRSRVRYWKGSKLFLRHSYSGVLPNSNHNKATKKTPGGAPMNVLICKIVSSSWSSSSLAGKYDVNQATDILFDKKLSLSDEEISEEEGRHFYCYN